MQASQGNSLNRVLIAVLVTLTLGYIASVLVPVVIASFRFSQAMDSEVVRGPLNEPAASVHRRLVGKAHELGLPVAPEGIVVTKDGPRFDIRADYVVAVEMIGGISFDWRLHPHKQGTRRPPAFAPD